MNWLGLALAAMAAWGWSGMVIGVTSAQPGATFAARAHVDGSFRTCNIEVNETGLVWTDALAWSAMLHEAGHCIGYYGFPWGDHSLTPESVMYASLTDSSAILDEDWHAVKMNRDMRLHYRLTLPGVAR